MSSHYKHNAQYDNSPCEIVVLVNYEDYEDDQDPVGDFREDMANAGLEVIEYKGRYFYEGPAVIVRDIQEAIRATQVTVQWDNMGRDFVVYPKV